MDLDLDLDLEKSIHYRSRSSLLSSLYFFLPTMPDSRSRNKGERIMVFFHEKDIASFRLSGFFVSFCLFFSSKFDISI